MKEIPIRKINTLEKEINSSQNFSIRNISDLLAGNDMVQELHRHDFYYILAINHGTGIHEIDFTHYEINDYTIFMMRPGQVHYLNLHAESTGYVIQFKADFLYSHNNAAQNHLTKLIQYNTYQLEAEGFAKMEYIMQEASKEYTEKVKGYKEVLRANLSIFLIELLRQRQEKALPPLPGNQYSQEKLEQFLELVEANCFKYKQVSHYTGLLHLSSYQLSAITKSLLNKTPSEIINDHIILEAKRELLATSNQVSQIAYNLGYEDASYFTRFFKKHTTTSPETFRQNSK